MEQFEGSTGPTLKILFPLHIYTNIGSAVLWLHAQEKLWMTEFLHSAAAGLSTQNSKQKRWLVRTSNLGLGTKNKGKRGCLHTAKLLSYYSSNAHRTDKESKHSSSTHMTHCQQLAGRMRQQMNTCSYRRRLGIVLDVFILMPKQWLMYYDILVWGM